MQTAHQAMADKPATPQRDDMATVALDTVLLDEEPTADQVLGRATSHQPGAVYVTTD